MHLGISVGIHVIPRWILIKTWEIAFKENQNAYECQVCRQLGRGIFGCIRMIELYHRCVGHIWHISREDSIGTVELLGDCTKLFIQRHTLLVGNCQCEVAMDKCCRSRVESPERSVVQGQWFSHSLAYQ